MFGVAFDDVVEVNYGAKARKKGGGHLMMWLR